MDNKIGIAVLMEDNGRIIKNSLVLTGCGNIRRVDEIIKNDKGENVALLGLVGYSGHIMAVNKKGLKHLSYYLKEIGGGIIGKIECLPLGAHFEFGDVIEVKIGKTIKYIKTLKKYTSPMGPNVNLELRLRGYGIL